MCGIVGILGREPVAGALIDALKRLEYRGYDSAGVATLEGGERLAIVSGLGSFLVALESVVARGRMMAFNKQVADLTSRVNELEGAEARRYMLELKRRGNTRSAARAKRRVGANDPEAGRNSKGTAPLGYESAALRSTDPKGKADEVSQGDQ